MTLAALFWIACGLWADLVEANAEKIIFVGPPTINLPATPPTLDVLGLDTLIPDGPRFRSELDASFPHDIAPQGSATWMLLFNLTAGQRYELRVCWAATQPTTFALDIFEVDHVFETPELITSLAEFSQRRQAAGIADRTVKDGPLTHLMPHAESASVLFLRVLAAADYYSDDPGRMGSVDPVLVDIILDQYLYNVLPRSLAPATIYIVCIALVGWFISQLTLRWIHEATSPLQVLTNKND